jgi:hypothetical protein
MDAAFKSWKAFAERSGDHGGYGQSGRPGDVPLNREEIGVGGVLRRYIQVNRPLAIVTVTVDSVATKGFASKNKTK